MPSSSRPLIAVSACLLGEPVRYDARHKRDGDLLSLLDGCEILPVCPEVGAGLGVPRAPIQVYCIDGELRVADRDDANIDHTASLTAFAQGWLAAHPAVCGGVLKSRSPSCAVSDTPFFDARGRSLSQAGGQGVGAGLFARALAPFLPLIDETGMRDEAARAAFFLAVAGACEALRERD